MLCRTYTSFQGYSPGLGLSPGGSWWVTSLSHPTLSGTQDHLNLLCAVPFEALPLFNLAMWLILILMRHSYTAPFWACCVGNNKTLMFQSFLAHTWDVSITYSAARSSCLCIVTSTHFHTHHEPTGYIYICLHIFVHDNVGTWLKMIACSISLNVCITTGTS